MAKLKSVPYFGSKIPHLNLILEHLPNTERYIEPFGGSAAVLLNREPSPVETYNDLDSGVVTFFRVLREQPGELIQELELTPYSREEFEHARDAPDDIDDVERARRFFIRITQGYNALPNASGWAYSVGNSRRGMSTRISMIEGYHEILHDVADRLKRVQIENRDAIEVIESHDHEDALIYADPPYLPSSRRRNRNEYVHEMTESDHRELAETLHSCESKVAVSAYMSPVVSDLYDGWDVVIGDERRLSSSRTHSDAHDQEALIMNYDPDGVTNRPPNGQATLTEAID